MTKSKKRIALVIDYLYSEYVNFLIKSISQRISEKDMDLFIFHIGSPNDQKDTFGYQFMSINVFVTKNNIDGIILISGSLMRYFSKNDFESFIKTYKSLPLVSISTSLKNVPSIIVDFKDAYSKLIKHVVIDNKAKKIAVIGVNSISVEVIERMEVVKSVIEESGIDFSSVTVLYSDFNYSGTIELLNKYYAEKSAFDFDAVIALNDDMAFACIYFVNSKGISVPNDLVIVGFDNLSPSSFSIPSLSTISQSLQEQGRVAADTIDELLNKKKVPPVQVVKAKAVFRQSTRASEFKDKYINDEDVSIEVNPIDNSKNTYTVSDWYMKSTRLFQAMLMYTSIENKNNAAQIINDLEKQLKAFDIKAASIVIYQKPIEKIKVFDYFNLPKKAYVFLAFDDVLQNEINSSTKKIFFNPNDTMIPDGIICSNNKGILVLPLFYKTMQYGYFLVRRSEMDDSIYEVITTSISSLIASYVANEEAQKENDKIIKNNKLLGNIICTDDLTSITNRRGFFDLGKKTLDFASSMGQTGLIVYCDMDGLKKINDSFGHKEGDKAIIAEAQILKKQFRSNDIVARIGGDEFAVVCPGLDIKYFNRIKKSIDNECQKWSISNDSKYKLSISLGTCIYPHEDFQYNLQSLLAEADSMLYLEKQRKKDNS